MYATLYGAVVDFVLNWFFIPRFGATGAAAATVVTEWVVAFVQMRHSWDDLKPTFKEIPYMKMLVSNVVSAGALLVVNRFLPEWNALVILIVTALVYFIVYGLVLLGMKDDLLVDYGVSVIKKFFRKKE